MSTKEKTGLILMTVLAVSTPFTVYFMDSPLNGAGIGLIVGIGAYFWIGDNFLSLRDVPKNLKNAGTVFLILFPLIIDIALIYASTSAVPELLEHVKNRTAFLAGQNLPILAVQILIMALGEEIAWRGFFQRTLRQKANAGGAVLFTAILFTLCHFNPGAFPIVFFDLFFVFINSIVFGVLFDRAQNLWINTLSHFLSNFFGILVMFYI